MNIINNQTLMTFGLTNDKLKMEIDIKDLVNLFNTDPNNAGDGPNGELAKIKRGKGKEFVKLLVEYLADEDDDMPYWAGTFQDAFDRIMESAEDDIIKFYY